MVVLALPPILTGFDVSVQAVAAFEVLNAGEPGGAGRRAWVGAAVVGAAIGRSKILNPAGSIWERLGRMLTP